MIERESMDDRREALLWLAVAIATVFFASVCIMAIEVTAGRIVSRTMGSSLYTWTAVIGVVLSGITVGNYLGGRLADRFAARNLLAVLFCVCSVSCVLVVMLNNTVGRWLWLWQFSWPVRVFAWPLYSAAWGG